MDTAADLAIQAILSRGTDFIGGIDNEALDFSQLEAFINSEGGGGGGYFSESLAAGGSAGPAAAPSPATAPTGKLLNVIVENKRNIGHALPDSPPDSGSEHPYSPPDSCEPNLNQQELIYTNLGQAHSHLYTTADTLVLGAGPAGLLVPGADRILLQASDSTHLDGMEGRMIIEGEGTGRILIQTGPPSQGSPSYSSPAQHHDSLETNLQFPSSSLSLDSGHHSHHSHGHATHAHTHQQHPQILTDQNLDIISTVPASTIPPATGKKRKLSQDQVAQVAQVVKSEPELCPAGQLSPVVAANSTSVSNQGSAGADDVEYAASESGACLGDAQYQCIRFQPFQQMNWCTLCDQNLTELPVPHYRVDADKGFNFSNADDAFVCQKKNHFQITCHVQLIGDAQFVKTAEGLQKINSFHLHFYGVKYDCPTQTIRVEQSQSDRSKKPFHPVLVSNSRVELVNSQVTKVTVGRLHFSETTSNNMRKKGKPNPEQRYFQLVVGLHAHTSHGHFPVASHASQRIIVRASNPGQFESDVELCWQKGQTQESIFHAGKVGINTDRPDESLVIHGNLKITGHIIQPSDLRAKKNIVECDTAEQLRNVQRLRVVRYEYAPGFASQLNLKSEIADTGVIAQEVAQIIPEAVSHTGDITLDNGRTINNFLVVNKERIFMENVGAVKELCKVTDNLETRIGQLERINRRLNKLKRDDSLKSNSTVTSKISNSQKCHKHHTCHKDEELCSNKFIQIVIVILVLIMAFCLAAITTLYLMEASRHSSQFAQSNIFNTHNGFNNKIPTRDSKLRTIPPIQNHNINSYKEKPDITNQRPLIENAISPKSPLVIGKPPYCQEMDSDIDTSSPCQVYCCSPATDNAEVESALYDKNQKSNLNLTKAQVSLISIDKNKINTFHSNNIDKQRQKRDADVEWAGEENSYMDHAEQYFTIYIQGSTFNMTLTNDYCFDCNTNTYNITYAVPISKYMSDEQIKLTFRSNHPNYKELESCQEYKPIECHNSIWDDGKTHSLHKPNRNIGLETVENKISGNVFNIDMVNVQYKTLIYRASLLQIQNVCSLSESKLGFEYIEYNLNFYRDCDEK